MIEVQQKITSSTVQITAVKEHMQKMVVYTSRNSTYFLHKKQPGSLSPEAATRHHDNIINTYLTMRFLRRRRAPGQSPPRPPPRRTILHPSPRPPPRAMTRPHSSAASAFVLRDPRVGWPAGLRRVLPRTTRSDTPRQTPWTADQPDRRPPLHHAILRPHLSRTIPCQPAAASGV